jgi:hypothetical protein
VGSVSGSHGWLATGGGAWQGWVRSAAAGRPTLRPAPRLQEAASKLKLQGPGTFSKSKLGGPSPSKALARGDSQ